MVVHELWGRASNRALPPALRERVLEIASGLDTVRRWRKRVRHRRRWERWAVLGKFCHFGQWRAGKGKRTDTIIALGLG